jgi:hypothetical protein
MSRDAQARLEDFMMLEGAQPRVVLFVLGWPWLPDKVKADELRQMEVGPAAVPWALSDRPREEIERMKSAADSAPSWLDGRRLLRERFDMEDRELAAFRAYMCRMRVEEALDGATWRAGSLHRAREALIKYATLTPAQSRTVLAMAAVHRLLQADPAAVPALADVLGRYPDLAAPILARLVQETGISAQADRAALRFLQSGSEAARRELRALGPFGAVALGRRLEQYPDGAKSSARSLLQDIEDEWPGRGGALDRLGRDPASWRRWYERAQGVL